MSGRTSRMRSLCSWIVILGSLGCGDAAPAPSPVPPPPTPPPAEAAPSSVEPEVPTLVDATEAEKSAVSAEAEEKLAPEADADPEAVSAAQPLPDLRVLPVVSALFQNAVSVPAAGRTALGEGESDPEAGVEVVSEGVAETAAEPEQEAALSGPDEAKCLAALEAMIVFTTNMGQSRPGRNERQEFLVQCSEWTVESADCLVMAQDPRAVVACMKPIAVAEMRRARDRTREDPQAISVDKQVKALESAAKRREAAVDAVREAARKLKEAAEADNP